MLLLQVLHRGPKPLLVVMMAQQPCRWMGQAWLLLIAALLAVMM
jgi:hypothetical protein